ncbi:MAG: hypothetical protein KGD63_15115 [Candidatus Lokiarchaeota archaeon]|nr:hypothetical protein [Candidatus Lokiarchaeota archaeon]
MEMLKNILDKTQNKYLVNIHDSEGLIESKVMTLTEINTKLMFSNENVKEINIIIK